MSKNITLTIKDYDEILEWTSKGNIGVSSNTILFAITGKSVYGNSRDIPGDWSDFNRCLTLYNSVKVVRDNLELVTKIYPKWIPIIREWEKLTELHLLADGTFYKYLDSLRDECYICDGFKKVGNGHWKRT